VATTVNSHLRCGRCVGHIAGRLVEGNATDLGGGRKELQPLHPPSRPVSIPSTGLPAVWPTYLPHLKCESTDVATHCYPCREGDPKGWSMVLIIALGSDLGKPVPRSHSTDSRPRLLTTRPYLLTTRPYLLTTGPYLQTTRPCLLTTRSFYSPRARRLRGAARIIPYRIPHACRNKQQSVPHY
jgi:hypothetical protein